MRKVTYSYADKAWFEPASGRFWYWLAQRHCWVSYPVPVKRSNR
jgi:hypothetical protein